MTTFADLTTLGLGGPARSFVEAVDDEMLRAALSDEALVVGGGSNLVVADAGVDRPVVLVRTRGVTTEIGAETAEVRIAAGEVWDEVVAQCVARGMGGVEALSGIPGRVGATPIQNVGAYGQEVADVLTGVEVFDRRRGVTELLVPEACEFGYRDSRFKREPERFVVLRVSLRLTTDGMSGPVAYAELADRLGVQLGERAPAGDVREAVLDLRRGKGMVLDPTDPDTRSAGSFFMNPVLGEPAFADLRKRAGADLAPPAWLQDDGRVKTSAAWLIQHAGLEKGYGDQEGIAISSKHVLALTNRGAGTTRELDALAREIADRVFDRFGVDLVPEPVFIGHTWR